MEDYITKKYDEAALNHLRRQILKEVRTLMRKLTHINWIKQTHLTLLPYSKLTFRLL